MAAVIIPQGDKWSDEHVWRVPYPMLNVGGIEREFAKWCRTSFTGNWRFRDIGDGRWDLVMLSDDDYLLLVMKYGESPSPKVELPTKPDPLETLYRNRLGRTA